jgi:acyl dehydratase
MATRELTRTPRIPPLYARAAASLLPGLSRLPFVGGGGGEIPELELTLRQVRVEPARLAEYLRLCAFTPGERLPATYPHMLAFPLHLALITDASFPFGPIGLIHIENRITQHRPLLADQALDLRVHTTPLQEHPRGHSFSLISEARVGGELVWEESSTMLHRGRGGGAAKGSTTKQQPTSLPDGEEWSLGEDLGRRYAAVSGDRNPIHLYALTAKPFGFPSAIVHGMWTKARCLAALEQRLPDAFTVDVRFRAPIRLPGRVSFGSAEDGPAIRFEVRDSSRGISHLEGRLEPLADVRTQTNERSSTL